ncbi:MAG TPA: hypothetical protein VI365_29450, partial [Trebonia sp.]
MITAQAGAEGFDGTTRLIEQQLPGARQQPGFPRVHLCWLATHSASAVLAGPVSGFTSPSVPGPTGSDPPRVAPVD